MLDLKLPWKKVAFNRPIDFAQWNLTEQVRGLHLSVDKEGDAIAVPVVIVDPSTEQVTSSANQWNWWGATGTIDLGPSTDGQIVITLPFGYQYQIDMLSCHGSSIDAGDTAQFFVWVNYGVQGYTELMTWATFHLLILGGIDHIVSYVPGTPLPITAETATVLPRFYATMVTSAALGTRHFNFYVIGRRRKMEMT